MKIDDADLEAVKAGLIEFNSRAAEVSNSVPVAVLARRGGALVGGATGYTQWGWLFIHYLWVSQDLRGEGLGTHLLGQAEAAARERGCGAMWLDTFSFQAPGFYPKLGYEPFGELDYPPGHKRIFLQKRLAGGA